MNYAYCLGSGVCVGGGGGGGELQRFSSVFIHWMMRISRVYLLPMDHAPTRQSLVHING